MRALTIQQPWVGAVAAGVKLVENRSWQTDWRGTLAIHAGRRWSERGAADDRIRAWESSRPDPGTFPTGLVLATAVLTDCHQADRCCEPWGEDSYRNADGKLTTAVWHWCLEDVVVLDSPVPAKGKLGLWHLDVDTDIAIAREADLARRWSSA